MEFIQSPNVAKGRGGKKIDLVVIHWFGLGTMDGAINSFKNPSRQASAHYLVSGSRIVQMVDESDTAWHCGVYAVNQRSIGIEHDATTDHDLSEESYRTAGKLLREICGRNSIPLDRDHIKGHREIKATQCPGTIDIDKLISIAKGDEVTESECQKRVQEVVDKYESILHHMSRNIVYETFNLILGRPGKPDEKTVADNADWMRRDSAGSPNYQGAAHLVVNLHNSDEKRANDQAKIDAAVAEALKSQEPKTVEVEKVVEKEVKVEVPVDTQYDTRALNGLELIIQGIKKIWSKK
jgi:hypothetical protein